MKETRLKVLLIEDDEDDYILTCDLLSDVTGTKYETTWISKYSEALDAICTGDQDVCLIDYRLARAPASNFCVRRLPPAAMFR